MVTQSTAFVFSGLLVAAVLVGCASSDVPAVAPSPRSAATSGAVTTTSSAVAGDSGIDVPARVALHGDHIDDVSDDTEDDDNRDDVEDSATDSSGSAGGSRLLDVSHFFEGDPEGGGGEVVSDDTSTASEVDGTAVDAGAGIEGADESDDNTADGVVSAVDDTGGGAVDVLDEAAGDDDAVMGDAGEAVGDAAVGDAFEDVGVEVATPVERYVYDGVGGVLVVGPCGWLGPVCPPSADTAPIDVGGPLRYYKPFEDWTTWVGRVLDLCDDHEALVALNKEWYIGSRTAIDYSTPIPDEAMVHVEELRRRHPVVCGPVVDPEPYWKCWDDGSGENLIILDEYLRALAKPPTRSEVLAWAESVGFDCWDMTAGPFWKCWGDGSGESIKRLREYLSGFTDPPRSSRVLAWAENVGLDCWDAAAERARYVYMTASGPMLPKSSIEAAIEGYLNRVAEAEDQQGTIAVGEGLGTYPDFYGYIVESPVDSLFVVAKQVSIIDGVLRGFAQNHSERLWARHVTVTATDPTGAVGEWQWPLTVQPLEVFPFEIENWTGTQDPTEVDFTITADLSPTIDLTRSLEFKFQTYYSSKGTYLHWHGYPEEMGAFPYGTTAFEALENGDQIMWTEFNIRRQGSTSHPRLAEAVEQQIINNLTVYAATVTDDTIDGTWIVEEVWEMTPMLPWGWPDSPDKRWTEMPHLPTEYSLADRTVLSERAVVGFVDVGHLYIWAGGANPDPQTPPDGTP